MELDKDFILSGTKNAQLNTWGNKYNSTVPNIKKEGSEITLSSFDCCVKINNFDEIVLTIILKFLFMPVWLMKQFYSAPYNILGMENIDDKINSWIQIGLIWKESSVTGEYVRPTYSLFDLFGETPYTYLNIPFNVLTHTISEEKVMFDIMTGDSEIVNIERKNNPNKLLPRISELGFNEDKRGTNVIAEEDFRNPNLFKPDGIKELNNSEHEIFESIKNGNNITPELTNFKLFPIVKKIDNTGIIKNDYKFHLPDLIIPTLRNNGNPQSIAIEIELTNKRTVNYVETLKRYKDNNKFGSLYWLCNNNSISAALRSAYDEIDGTGTCKMYLLEFVVPFPEF